MKHMTEGYQGYLSCCTNNCGGVTIIKLLTVINSHRIHLRKDNISGLLRNHIQPEHRECAYDLREDRHVDDPEPVNTADPEVAVEHRAGVAISTDRTLQRKVSVQRLAILILRSAQVGRLITTRRGVAALVSIPMHPPFLPDGLSKPLYV